MLENEAEGIAMKNYEEPQMDVVRFDDRNIVRTSAIRGPGETKPNLPAY